MNSQLKIKAQQLTAEALNDLIIDSIQDIKGKNILLLDLRHLEDAPADFFIICEGESNTQVKAISNNIYRRLKEDARTAPLHIEGQSNARWICMDYFSVAVHIFYKEARTFYELEDLWSDAIFTEYENI
ncbi:MAG TPA: ribosome silencing factor [Saprospiraceae bacterium]|nr:ribosome silencing factor [Saprospiraceae bacterium]HMP12643.1 ribosome silencing factor [Saprospiraceae bacterium]